MRLKDKHAVAVGGGTGSIGHRPGVCSRAVPSGDRRTPEDKLGEAVAAWQGVPAVVSTVDVADRQRSQPVPVG